MMPKSRKKTILTSTTTTTLIEMSDEFDLPICCSNRNCPSHWHDRLTEKLKILQQAKLKPKSKHQYHLLYPDILSKLFQLPQSEELEQTIYSKPIAKSILLNKHNFYHQQITKRLNDSTYTFNRMNLNLQINSRLIALRFERMHSYEQLKITQLRINHIHFHQRLVLKIISQPIWNRSAVHVIVQDDHRHCLHLAIYNWSYVIDTRQMKSTNYIQERLKNLLSINSSIILLEPWLKQCHDGEIALRCESPNTHLILLDYDRQESISSSIDVEQLRQLGNACYQADDSLSAIEFYTFGLKQLDEQQEKELTSKGQTIGPKTDEREHNRIRFLSNRSACYLRERHAALAIAETGNLLSFNEFSPVFGSNKLTTGKLLFRCLNAHLQLGLYDRVEGLLKSHKFGVGLSGGENPASMTILERELIRLKNESTTGRYDLQEMLNEQVTKKIPMMFIDLSHHHAECQRKDLFEVRTCPEEKHGYSRGSYGVYAREDLQAGTLLIVEQPFASVDNRLASEEYSQSINTWKNHSRTQIYSNESLRLINEVEKQLAIGNTTPSTFEKIQCMQPIRQWLEENSDGSMNETTDVLEGFEQILSGSQQWKLSETKRISPAQIPWRVLFQTQQENPYKSHSTLGWYPLGSMLNHSCLPNCLWYLIGDYLFIYVCTTNVRQGDELTISYCPLWIASCQERANRLRVFDIHACRCQLCLYDRLRMEEYENELKIFVNIRALARQKKKISNGNRWNYLQQLKSQYEILMSKFPERPVGFINEFRDLESISSYFSQENLDQEIKQYLKNEQESFLPRLAKLAGITGTHISNPIVLFGPLIQLLIDYLEQSSSLHSQTWNDVLRNLYEIYTFKCYSSLNDPEKTLKDQKQFFTNLFQTQSWIVQEKKT